MLSRLCGMTSPNKQLAIDTFGDDILKQDIISMVLPRCYPGSAG
jgi:hypothetical protein